jgi:L-ascorbate metabolism protein UlaG (beta-lactamase superfamily)
VVEIGSVDILLIPVGGFFTIDARTATEVCNQLQPRVIIPMHYRTEKSFPEIFEVDEFIKGKNNVTRQDSSEVEFKADKLPDSTQIMVLKPAL